MSGLRPGEHHGVRSECSACGEVFCGVGPFDDHRVGEHGLRTGPKQRRCLSAAEMADGGFSTCSLGRWGRPVGSTTRARTPGKAQKAVGAVAAEAGA